MAASKTISPMESALDSIKRLSKEFEACGKNDVMALKSASAWGWHAVSLLAYMRLQPARDSFDPWVQDYLHEGEPELDAVRDSHWEEKQSFTHLLLLDILSELDLPSLKPEFYQGWQDRMSRCRELRRKVRALVGSGLSAGEREKLLLLLAVHQRLVRVPAGITLELTPVLEALPTLLDLIEKLIDRTLEPTLIDELDRCRAALKAR